MKNLFSKMMVVGMALAMASYSFADQVSSDGVRNMTDPRDGKTYKTVKIGDQVWMAENLNVLNVKTAGSKCYDNDPTNCKKYGRLYTWEAAMHACPDGWHLPSVEEFQTLLETVELRVDQIVTQKKLNAEPLKRGEANFYNHLRDASWNDGFGAFGFSALPAGYYNSYDKTFENLGGYAYFWSSTENGEDLADRLAIAGTREHAGLGNVDERDGLSVRCLKDSN